MGIGKIRTGRPKLEVDFGLLLDYRENQHLGWLRVARKYSQVTGEFISKQTCRRRYLERKEIRDN